MPRCPPPSAPPRAQGQGQQGQQGQFHPGSGPRTHCRRLHTCAEPDGCRWICSGGRRSAGGPSTALRGRDPWPPCPLALWGREAGRVRATGTALSQELLFIRTPVEHVFLLLLLFFFFFFLLWPHLQQMEVPGLRVKSEVQHHSHCNAGPTEPG